MRELSKKENPHIYLSESVDRLTGMLGRKIPYETACSSLLSQMEDVYKDAVFDYPWQKKDALIND